LCGFCKNCYTILYAGIATAKCKRKETENTKIENIHFSFFIPFSLTIHYGIKKEKVRQKVKNYRKKFFMLENKGMARVGNGV